MKNLFFTIMLIYFFAFNFLYAKVYTVSSVASVKAEFQNLQDAVDISSPGDTIYLHGSADTCILNKKLVILGAGYNPNNSNLIPSKISFLFLEGATNSIIQGIRGNVLFKSGTDSSHKIIIRRCMIDSINILGNEWLIYNNIILRTVNINYCDDIVVSNNIFTRDISGNNKIPELVNSSNNSLIVKNNIFFQDSDHPLFCYSGLFGNTFQNINSVEFSNNIFLTNARGAENCTFLNNIYLSSDDGAIGSGPYSCEFEYGTNNYSNNYNIGQLKHENKCGFIKDSIYQFQYYDDLHLKSTSPGKNAGTDGKDIGIYGGDFPWPDNSDGTPDYTGESNLPKVQSLTVSPVKVFIEGSIKVNSKGIKKDRSK